jgi:hypothetical protein
MNKDDFDLLFENPLAYRQPPGEFGILYLLRRDINRCLTPGEGSWLGAMGIFAGIDLLAKFYKGTDKGEVGKRFRLFTRKYFDTSGNAEAVAIYQLRNAMMHSFGLYSRVGGVDHRFCLSVAKVFDVKSADSDQVI